jgi:hypothetical protein
MKDESGRVVAMDSATRIERYRKARGTYRLTPRQRRRVAHKHNHMMAPFVREALHRHDEVAR